MCKEGYEHTLVKLIPTGGGINLSEIALTLLLFNI